MTIMLTRNTLRTMALGAAFISALALLGACSEKKVEFRGVDITGADYARELALTDHNGQARQLRDFAGKVVVVFFGYTQCPDVCPTTLQELAEVKQLLGKDGGRLQAILVTVDPERDTPEVLKAYMTNFDPGFLALRGSAAQLASVAKDFKIYYKKVDGQTPGNYTIDHSAGSYLYDPAGRLRVYHRYGSGAQALAADVKILLGLVSGHTSPAAFKPPGIPGGGVANPRHIDMATAMSGVCALPLGRRTAFGAYADLCNQTPVSGYTSLAAFKPPGIPDGGVANPHHHGYDHVFGLRLALGPPDSFRC